MVFWSSLEEPDLTALQGNRPQLFEPMVQEFLCHEKQNMHAEVSEWN